MSSNRKVICAGCTNRYLIDQTTFYRNKRWCGNNKCKEVIDIKVKQANYKKAQKKILKGTFRHGVLPELREYIKNRDDFTCRLCSKRLSHESLQVHHIIPVSNGGTDEGVNLVLLCYHCHTGLHKDGWEKYIDKLMVYTKEIEKQFKEKIVKSNLSTY